MIKEPTLTLDAVDALNPFYSDLRTFRISIDQDNWINGMRPVEIIWHATAPVQPAVFQIYYENRSEHQRQTHVDLFK